MQARLARIVRYPVKGLPGQMLDRCEVEAGRALPGDRRWAMTHGRSGFDPLRPAWKPRGHFLNLADAPQLSRLDAIFDAAGRCLTIRCGAATASGQLDVADERARLEAHVAGAIEAARGAVRIVEVPGQALHDLPSPWLTLIGLDTIEDLARRSGTMADPLRWRANFYIAGIRAWSEHDWIDRVLLIGTARFRVTGRVERCAAIDVEPGSGVRDRRMLATLQRLQHESEMGGYLECIAPGIVELHDRVQQL